MTNHTILTIVQMSLLAGSLYMIWVVSQGPKDSKFMVLSRDGGAAKATSTVTTMSSVPEAARILHAQLDGFKLAGESPQDDAKHILVYSSLGRIYLEQGSFAEAIGYFFKARERAQRLEDGKQLMATRTALGDALRRIGRYVEAEEELIAASHGIGNRQRLNPDACQTLHALGNVHRDLGDVEQAITLYKEVLDKSRRIDDTRYDEMPALITDLALGLHMKGSLDEAIAKYHEALDLQAELEKHGDYHGSHLVVGDIYLRMGQAFHDKGEVHPAKKLYLKALQLRKNAMRADHLLIAEPMLSLARAQRDLGEVKAALAWCEKAETLVPKSSNKQYIHLLVTKADVLRENKLLKQAEATSRLALETQERILGAERTPDLAVILNSLANIVQDQNRIWEATEVYKRAIEVWTRTVGVYDSETAATYNNLGNAYQDLGVNDEAEKFYKKCLEIQKKILPSNCADIAAVTSNIATILVGKQQYDEALDLAIKAVDVALSAGLPPGHPERKTYEDNVAEIKVRMQTSAQKKVKLQQGSGWSGRSGHLYDGYTPSAGSPIDDEIVQHL